MRTRSWLLLAVACTGCVSLRDARLVESYRGAVVSSSPYRCGPVGFRRAPLGARWGEYLRVTASSPRPIVGTAQVVVNGRALPSRAWESDGALAVMPRWAPLMLQGALGFGFGEGFVAVAPPPPPLAPYQVVVVDETFTNDDPQLPTALSAELPMDVTLATVRTAGDDLCEGVVFRVEQGVLQPNDEGAWAARLELEGGAALLARREARRQAAEEARLAALEAEHRVELVRAALAANVPAPVECSFRGAVLSCVAEAYLDAPPVAGEAGVAPAGVALETACAGAGCGLGGGLGGGANGAACAGAGCRLGGGLGGGANGAACAGVGCGLGGGLRGGPNGAACAGASLAGASCAAGGRCATGAAGGSDGATCAGSGLVGGALGGGAGGASCASGSCAGGSSGAGGCAQGAACGPTTCAGAGCAGGSASVALAGACAGRACGALVSDGPCPASGACGVVVAIGAQVLPEPSVPRCTGTGTFVTDAYVEVDARAAAGVEAVASGTGELWAGSVGAQGVAGGRLAAAGLAPGCGGAGWSAWPVGGVAGCVLPPQAEVLSAGAAAQRVPVRTSQVEMSLPAADWATPSFQGAAAPPMPLPEPEPVLISASVAAVEQPRYIPVAPPPAPVEAEVGAFLFGVLMGATVHAPPPPAYGRPVYGPQPAYGPPPACPGCGAPHRAAPVAPPPPPPPPPQQQQQPRSHQAAPVTR